MSWFTLRIPLTKGKICNSYFKDVISHLSHRFKETCSKYPFINPDTEDSYLVNYLMTRRLRKLGRATKLKFEDIRNPYILNDFCIFSPNGTWKISDDVELTPCSHEGKKTWLSNFLPKFFSNLHYQ